MHDFEKLRSNAEKELKIIEEKGLDKNNIELAGKLTEMIKGIDKICMMQDEGEYSNDRGSYSMDSEDYDRGNSYRRGRSRTTGRYVHRSNYSRLSGDDRDMEEYRERKREYSNARDSASKDRMLDALEEFMGGMCGMIKQICRDADCSEEREIVMRYIKEMERSM